MAQPKRELSAEETAALAAKNISLREQLEQLQLQTATAAPPQIATPAGPPAPPPPAPPRAGAQSADRTMR